MKLLEAEKAKQIQIVFAKEFMNQFLHDAQKLYIFDAYSAMVKQWNTLTKDCVEFAFTKILYPMMTKELRNKLTREAKGKLLQMKWVFQIANSWNSNFDDCDMEK